MSVSFSSFPLGSCLAVAGQLYVALTQPVLFALHVPDLLGHLQMRTCILNAKGSGSNCYTHYVYVTYLTYALDPTESRG
jgi:hypothetical protein